MTDLELTESFINRLLKGELFKIPASTQKAADAIRSAVLDFVITNTTEPIEIMIKGSEPVQEVWIRKLHGGRPAVFACSCGRMGSENELSKHFCQYKK